MKYFSIFFLALFLFFDSAAQDNTAEVDLNAYFKNAKWRNIGPFRGGRSVSAHGVPGDPLTYYMGTTGGGVWKTTDAGQHWHNISDGYFKTGSVGAVAVSSSNPNIVYVGMGEHAPRGVMTSYGDGVYKSTDAGKTWKHMGLEETQQIARIRIHPDNPDVVYVAAQGALHGPNKERGVYLSNDGGETWKQILYVNDRTGCSELDMDLSNPLVLYAGMWEHQRKPWIVESGPGGSVQKSVDGGKTWKMIHDGLPEEKGKIGLSICQSNPEKIYCILEGNSNEDLGGLFVSENGGNSWSRVSDDNRLTQRAWYYTEVFADPQNENTVYVLSAPCLRSIDGGKSWSRISGTHGDYHDLWINPDNTKNLCIANDGGAAISFNHGKSWSTQANMPTAQFYRVTVDNLFPYNIYGGQQDNSSVRIAHRNLSGRSIGPRDWTYSAGGESAFLAFDPDDPKFVLGGSYLGSIEVLDIRAGTGTNVMAAPIQYLGREARDMKYRYNWNAPIIWSQHEPNTYYHAAQKLLRTKDFGLTWDEVSPDLSNHDDAKLGNGGGPLTNEAVGAENYGTISYVAESPHEAGVIWVSTDDGVVQLTTDGCKTWNRVTPKGMPEGLVNAIDVSPHDPATAYIAMTRYKFNDKTPFLYKTNDYGKTWTNISAGIPYGAFTRVVREDDERRGLLVAGTETGLYISFNDGEKWQPFQLNMPVTPILDLIIKHGDIVAATSGRSFWVFDDLGLVRQYEEPKEEIVLFEPEPVILTAGGSQLNSTSESFMGTNSLTGVNPATGAVIYYQLPDVEDEEATIEIRDANGRLVRTLSSKKEAFQRWDGGPPSPASIPNKKGLNRFVWDLRHETMDGVPGVYIEGNYRGHKAIPGTYGVTLRHGDVTKTTTVEIKPNPYYSTTPEEYAEYDQFMSETERNCDEMHQMINTMYDLRNDLEELVDELPESDSELAQATNALIDEMKKWDDDMVQRLSKAYDDVENFPNKFTANYLFMINRTESDIPRVNQPSKDRRAEMDAKWEEYRTSASEILDKKLPVLNQKFWENGIGALRLKGKARS